MKDSSIDLNKILISCRYRRYPDHHEFVEDLFCHSDDVEDIDISPYDECILGSC